MLRILWMFIVGLVVGALARLLYPGAQSLGLLMTGLLGIAGSFVGGFIGMAFSRPVPGRPFHPAGFVLSIIGSIVVLWVWIHFGH